MIRVDELVDFFFDSACVEWDVIFGKELFLFVIVDFVIANRADFGLFAFFGCQQSGQFFFLYNLVFTSFLSLFS